MQQSLTPPSPPAAHAYRTRVVPVPDLPPPLVQQMADLYLGHYAGSSQALFCSDLAAKDEAVVLLHADKLVGFSLLKVYGMHWQGQPLRVLYSGDTVVAQAHWGQQALAFATIARMGQVWRQTPTQPLYWFLLVKGHRTYKYLSAFARQFYPHWAQAQPRLQALAAHLAQQKFGADYDAASGLVRFAQSRGHLQAAIAEAPPQEQHKAATQFFLQQNPGYRQGHELVCLCALEPDNLRPLAQRIFCRGLHSAAHNGTPTGSATTPSHAPA